MIYERHKDPELPMSNLIIKLVEVSDAKQIEYKVKNTYSKSPPKQDEQDWCSISHGITNDM